MCSHYATPLFLAITAQNENFVINIYVKYIALLTGLFQVSLTVVSYLNEFREKNNKPKKFPRILNQIIITNLIYTKLINN